MAIFLVCRVTDVLGATQDGVEVTVEQNGVRPLASTNPPQSGVSEIKLSDTNTVAGFPILKCKKAGFFDVSQPLLFQDAGGTPTVQFDGFQRENVRRIAMAARGAGDFNAEVHVVLGQLSDCQSKVSAVDPVIGGALLPITGQMSPDITGVISKAGTPLLGPDTATGLARIGSTQETVTAQGRFLVAERQTVPKLVAIWRPKSLGPVDTGTSSGAIDYHIFYHPFIHGGFDLDYPFRPSYIDLLRRYMVSDKALVLQHAASAKKTVLVFPIGSRKEQFGSFNTQANLLRLLQEITYWLPRMVGISNPQNTVGKLAISFFSAGIRDISAVLGSAKEPTFFDSVLKEVYSLDGVFAGPGGDAERSRFLGLLKAWYRSGSGDRKIRIYSQSDWSELDGDVGGARTRRFGCSELHGPNGTILKTPSTFWKSVGQFYADVDPNFSLYDKVHQTIPMMFATHGLANSSFA